MLTLVLAAVAALPASPLGIMNDDYPVAAIKAHHEGWVAIELTVDTSGSVPTCRTVSSSGWAELDRASCELPLKRVHYRPATVDGVAIGYVYRLRFRWAFPHSSFPAAGPDTREAVLNLKAYPADMKRPSTILEFVVAPDGRVESCMPQQEWGSGSAALNKIACNLLSKSETFPPALDRSGKAMRFMRVQSVGFTIDAPK